MALLPRRWTATAAHLITLLVTSIAVSAGCGSDGRYALTWQFTDDQEMASADRCGAHGVESLSVTESSDSGDVRHFQTLCAFGTIERDIPPGNWTVNVIGLDLQARPPTPAEGTLVLRGAAGPFKVVADADVVPVSVAIVPRPRCADGVDNDRDGAIDADDPGCQTGADE